MSNNKLEISLAYLDIVPDELINSIYNEINSKNVKLTIKKRKSEPMAALEWFIPAALMVCIIKPYSEAFLQEMGKDHYQVIKRAILSGAKRLLGKDKIAEVKVISSQNSQKKVSRKYSLAFSTLITLPSKYKIKFLFDDFLSIEELEDYVDKITKYVFTNTDEEIIKIITRNGNIVLMNTLICTYDKKSKEIIVLNLIQGKDEK